MTAPHRISDHPIFYHKIYSCYTGSIVQQYRALAADQTLPHPRVLCRSLALLTFMMSSLIVICEYVRHAVPLRQGATMALLCAQLATSVHVFCPQARPAA